MLYSTTFLKISISINIATQFLKVVQFVSSVGVLINENNVTINLNQSDIHTQNNF